MQKILEKCGYSREFLYPSYAKYIKGDNALYTFLVDSEEYAVSFVDKVAYTKYELLKKFKITAKEYEELCEEQRTFKYQNPISQGDLFMNLYNLKNGNNADKEIMLNSQKQETVFLFNDTRINGCASLDREGRTHFRTQREFGFWSPQKKDIQRDKKIKYTNSLSTVINRDDGFNFILGKAGYKDISFLMEKYPYKMIEFAEPVTWFIGNIVNLNHNNPNTIIPCIGENETILYSSNRIDCLDDYKELTKPFQHKYIIENSVELFGQVVAEVAKGLEIAVEGFQT
jgi:hypothetical protein